MDILDLVSTEAETANDERERANDADAAHALRSVSDMEGIYASETKPESKTSDAKADFDSALDSAFARDEAAFSASYSQLPDESFSRKRKSSESDEFHDVHAGSDSAFTASSSKKCIFHLYIFLKIQKKSRTLFSKSRRSKQKKRHSAAPSVEHDSAFGLEDPAKLYCYCQKPYNEDLFYIQESQLDSIILFYCIPCEASTGLKTVRRRLCAAYEFAQKMEIEMGEAADDTSSLNDPGAEISVIAKEENSPETSSPRSSKGPLYTHPQSCLMHVPHESENKHDNNSNKDHEIQPSHASSSSIDVLNASVSSASAQSASKLLFHCSETCGLSLAAFRLQAAISGAPLTKDTKIASSSNSTTTTAPALNLFLKPTNRLISKACASRNEIERKRYLWENILKQIYPASTQVGPVLVDASKNTTATGTDSTAPEPPLDVLASDSSENLSFQPHLPPLSSASIPKPSEAMETDLTMSENALRNTPSSQQEPELPDTSEIHPACAPAQPASRPLEQMNHDMSHDRRPSPLQTQPIHHSLQTFPTLSSPTSGPTRNESRLARNDALDRIKLESLRKTEILLKRRLIALQIWISRVDDALEKCGVLNVCGFDSRLLKPEWVVPCLKEWMELSEDEQERYCDARKLRAPSYGDTEGGAMVQSSGMLENMSFSEGNSEDKKAENGQAMEDVKPGEENPASTENMCMIEGKCTQHVGWRILRIAEVDVEINLGMQDLEKNNEAMQRVIDRMRRRRAEAAGVQ
ncbi:hypothetical protein HDU77_001184 [Chytriomyces hyalinus]|nr:hypothetical protein HDU77_001184 [Chytriomyces hyalinus]